MSSGAPSLATSRASVRPVSGASSSASRRRPRSVRLLWACLLVAVSAVAVGAAVVIGTRLVLTVAGAVAVLLAAAAVWIVWAEVVEARRLAARDRADQARAYRDLAASRSIEQTHYVADIRGRLSRQEATIGSLEGRLAGAAAAAAEARRELATERTSDQDRAAALSTLRAERDEALLERDQALLERDQLGAGIEDARRRAAEAGQRVGDLESELDLVMREWRSGAEAPRRKHA